MNLQDMASFASVDGYVVCDALPEHAAQAIEFFKNVRQESPYLLLQATEGIQDVAIQARQFETMASERKQAILFVWHAGDVIGFVGISRGAFRRNKHTASLALAVVSAHQGRGVGSYLLGRALAWAKHENIRRVELCVAVENRGAVRLYERHGFVAEGTKRQSFLIDGKFVDEHVTACLLPSHPHG